MTEEINQKKSLNPIADRVEKRTKEISIKSEKLINYGLDTLKDLKPLGAKPKYVSNNLSNFKKGFS